MIELVKANVSYLDELQQICIDAYTMIFGDHWIENGLSLYLEDQFNRNRLNQELSSFLCDYFFIRSSNTNIGFAKIKYKTSLEFSKLDNCELEKIYILPKYSGKGIGKYVLGNIIETVKRRDKKLIYLCVIDTNLNAISFYQRNGFKFHSKTQLDALFFKDELKGMHRMYRKLDS